MACRVVDRGIKNYLRFPNIVAKNSYSLNEISYQFSVELRVLLTRSFAFVYWIYYAFRQAVTENV